MSFLPPPMKPRGAHKTIGTVSVGVALMLAGFLLAFPQALLRRMASEQARNQ